MKWIDVDQTTDEEEWLNLRVGRVGGSDIAKVMANAGKAFGDPAHKLAVKIALESVDGIPRNGGYSNEHMDRGKEQEPIARQLYSETCFTDVLSGGYYQAGEYIGCSPDGLVDDCGLVEIKSVIYSQHYDVVEKNRLDPSYKWQVNWNLKTANKVDPKRVWIDYVSFCSEFTEDKRLFIERVKIEDCAENFVMIDTRFGEFVELVKKKIAVIKR